ncbi:MAG: hypothetical protein ACYDCH_03265 [Gaiellaceae bacterium]
MKRLVLIAALALAGPAPASAGLPILPGPSVVGEGVPLKAYATVTPTVHLFGDALTASVAVVADTKWVDPSRLRVRTSFAPYEAVREPTLLQVRTGRFAELTWTWTLRCLTSQCVPRVPPSDKYHVFHFASIHIDYLPATGLEPLYGITASWPPVEVMSQVSPGVAATLARTSKLNWRFHLSPVSAPTYRMSPAFLFWLALGLALVTLLGAGVFARRWYLALRPPAAAPPGAPPLSPLERALAVLIWARERGDETLQRKALERVAGELRIELPRSEVDELSRTARQLAWSSDAPPAEEVDTFAEQARETGRHDDEVEEEPAQ